MQVAFQNPAVKDILGVELDLVMPVKLPEPEQSDKYKEAAKKRFLITDNFDCEDQLNSSLSEELDYKSVL